MMLSAISYLIIIYSVFYCNNWRDHCPSSFVRWVDPKTNEIKDEEKQDHCEKCDAKGKSKLDLEIENFKKEFYEESVKSYTDTYKLWRHMKRK